MSAPHDTSGPWTRWGLRLFATACAFWILHYPLRMDRLYRAIPDDVALTSYHRGLAREWRWMAQRQDILSLLEAAGVEDAQEWRDEQGIFQTLYWLTGHHTVFGLQATPQLDRSLMTVYGASYVGWKARPMELLWRLRWIPGLGRLEVTPSGTRYMVFRKSKTMRRLGLVLSLDIFEGVLVGALSSNPDAVRELAFRILHDSDVSHGFGGDARPWSEIPAKPHRVWLPRSTTAWLSNDLGDWCLDVRSFAEPSLSLFASGSPECAMSLLPQLERIDPSAGHPGPDVVAAAPFAALALPGRLVERLGTGFLPEGQSSLGRGQALVLLSGKPYEGRILGLALPALQARLPWPEDADARAWAQAVVDRLNHWGKLGPVLLRTDQSIEGRTISLLDAAKANLFGRTADQDCVFLERTGNTLILGTHLGSHLRQSLDPAAGETGFWSAMTSAFGRSDVLAWLWIDLPQAYEELRHAAAIYRMVARLSGSGSALETDRRLGQALQVLQAANALGKATMTVWADGERLRIQVETEGFEAGHAQGGLSVQDHP